MDYNLTEEQVLNVKHVLFGNQKQANVTNEAVVKIVARGISEVKGANSLNSESSFVEACRDYLQMVIEAKTTGTDTLIMLLAGEKSLANLNDIGPKQVYVNQPNPESPKHVFRILMLGQEAEVDMSAEDNVIPVSSGASVSTSCPYERDDDIPTKARKIKDAILPLVPDIVKKELAGNEYAQALYEAEYYYKNVYKESMKSAVTNAVKTFNPADYNLDTQAIAQITRDQASGKSLGEIAGYFKVGANVIKQVLNSKGHNVQ